jgi:DNA-binding LacI/PurR family transcriptional regulator
VKEPTRLKVLQAIEQLGYRPNAAARALRKGRFGTIGFVGHRVNRAGGSRTVSAIVDAARERGYAVTLVDLPGREEHELTPALVALGSQAVDGLIVGTIDDASNLELALPPHVPTVMFDNRYQGNLASLYVDDATGVKAAVEHLLSLGHQTVHHISGPVDSFAAHARRAAWQAALLAAGRDVPAVVEGDWSPEAGYKAGRLLARNPDVTAILCASDNTAIGALRALTELGRSVPGDISIVGFDGMEIVAYLSPPLTTVFKDYNEVGRRLVELLVQQIEGDRLDEKPNETIETELLIRESTSAASVY